MGVPSSTPCYSFDQIYLPADCFRLCNPDACFCRGGHQGRNKYVYVDQRNSRNNRESYCDPIELIERGMVPPGYWAMTNLDRWRAKDYEIMSRVLAQLNAEKRGIMEMPWAEILMGGGTNGMGGMGSVNGMQGFCPMGNQGWGPWQQQASWANGCQGMGMGKKDLVDISEMRERVQLHDDIMFGSEAERREKQVDEQLLKRFQPMIPELAKLIALQQAGLAGGNGGGAAAGMVPGMPGAPMGMSGANPFAMQGGMQMMNPYAGMMSGMSPMMMGGDPGMMGGGDMSGRRRPRGRRGRDFDFDDDDDDDFGFGRGRGGRRRRRGRFNGLFDDDDFGGDGSRSPRRPPKGPSRPRPGKNGGGGGGGGGGSPGGGGAVFDTLNDDARFGSAPAGVPQPAHWASPPRATEPRAPPPMASAPLDRVLTPIQDGLVGSPHPMPVTRPPSGAAGAWPPPGAIPNPGEGAPPYRSHPGTFDIMPTPPTYSGTPAGGFPTTRPVPERRVNFQAEAALSRPRTDEEDRGEPEAGDPTGRRDTEPL